MGARTRSSVNRSCAASSRSPTTWRSSSFRASAISSPMRIRSWSPSAYSPSSTHEVSASIVRSDAEDEDPFRLQEALPQDRQGQVPRPAVELEPYPREEVAWAEAASRAAFGYLRRRPKPRQEAA